MAFKSIALLGTLIATVSAVYVSSPAPVTHNAGRAFCSSNKGLLDVNFANLEQVKAQFGNQYIWIGSWNYDYGNDTCFYFHKGHIGAMDCKEPLVAACNNQVVYKSTAQIPDDQQEAVEQQYSQITQTEQPLHVGENANEHFQYLFRN